MDSAAMIQELSILSASIFSDTKVEDTDTQNQEDIVPLEDTTEVVTSDEITQLSGRILRTSILLDSLNKDLSMFAYVQSRGIDRGLVNIHNRKGYLDQLFNMKLPAVADLDATASPKDKLAITAMESFSGVIDRVKKFIIYLWDKICEIARKVKNFFTKQLPIHKLRCKNILHAMKHQENDEEKLNTNKDVEVYSITALCRKMKKISDVILAVKNIYVDIAPILTGNPDDVGGQATHISDKITDAINDAHGAVGGDKSDPFPDIQKIKIPVITWFTLEDNLPLIDITDSGSKSTNMCDWYKVIITAWENLEKLASIAKRNTAAMIEADPQNAQAINEMVTNVSKLSTEISNYSGMYLKLATELLNSYETRLGYGSKVKVF